jgi:hypothetical protein
MKTQKDNKTVDNNNKIINNTLLNDDGNSVKTSKFQQRLTNISKKLGLSYAVFQR